jgi:hypothetical protein
MPDHTRSIAEIEASIADRRKRLDQTEAALRHKVAPMQLATRGIEMIRHSSNGTTRRLGAALAQNPVPIALIGIGAGWMLWSAMISKSRHSRVRERLHEMADHADSDAPTVPTPSKAMDETQTLAIGGLAAVAGALIAYLLPPTRSEDALMGAARDAMADRTDSLRQDGISRFETIARDAAAAAMGAAIDTVREELGDTPAKTPESASA